MNKNLPKVFAVPINKSIKNNKDIFISNDADREVIEERIAKTEINKIFNAKTHVYKTRVKISTNTGQKEVDVVGMNNNALLTLKGESIPIKDIIEIKKV